MASIICVSCKVFLGRTHDPYTYTVSDSPHIFAIIAKGNILEGIEARW